MQTFTRSRQQILNSNKSTISSCCCFNCWLVVRHRTYMSIYLLARSGSTSDDIYTIVLHHHLYMACRILKRIHNKLTQQQHRSRLVVLCCCCCCCCCFVHHKWTKQKFTGSHSKPSHTVYCVLLICMWSTEAGIKPVCNIIQEVTANLHILCTVYC